MSCVGANGIINTQIILVHGGKWYEGNMHSVPEEHNLSQHGGVESAF